MHSGLGSAATQKMSMCTYYVILVPRVCGTLLSSTDLSGNEGDVHLTFLSVLFGKNMTVAFLSFYHISLISYQKQEVKVKQILKDSIAFKRWVHSSSWKGRRYLGRVTLYSFTGTFYPVRRNCCKICENAEELPV